MSSDLGVGQQKPPSHRTFQLGSLTFSSDFDSGNLSLAEKANSVSVTASPYEVQRLDWH